MEKKIIINIIREYFIFIIILIFIIIKIPFLTIPFYWDEASSYARALFDIHDKGLAILPGGADPELTRGHPLFFYFSAALWMDIFGTSLLSCHSFSLLISALTIFALYKLCINLFNYKTAIISVLFLVCQSYFLAQSTLLLPEIFLTLFTILTINAYFKKKWWLFALFSSAVVMIKETGIILIVSFIFDKIILSKRNYSEEIKIDKKYIKEVLFLMVPVFVFCSMLIIQKIRLGWFLFPEHLGMIKIGFRHTAYCIKEYSKLLFFQNGRILLFIITAIISLYIFIKKKYDLEKLHVILFFMLFIILFLLFSSINFFSTRYLLSVLPLYLIIGGYLISFILANNKIILIFVIGGFFLVFTYITFYQNIDESDVSIGFINTVKLHKEVVNYCENNQWQNKNIFTGFLMMHNFKEPYLGYLNDKTLPFNNVSNAKDKNYNIYIYYSIDNDANINNIKNNKDYLLIKRFENGRAWADIYKNIYRK